MRKEAQKEIQQQQLEIVKLRIAEVLVFRKWLIETNLIRLSACFLSQHEDETHMVLKASDFGIHDSVLFQDEKSPGSSLPNYYLLHLHQFAIERDRENE